MNAKKNQANGFTLVELLIAIAISGILMTGVYAAFKSQQDSYLAQEQVAEMQQNIRAGLHFMAREIREAGYDPENTLGAGIVTATAGRLGFTRAELDADGKPTGASEEILYGFKNEDDSEANGMADGGVASLGRSVDDEGFEPVADNFQAIEFFYRLADGTQTTTPNNAQLAQIRTIRISMLARARHPDRNFRDSNVYQTASGVEWGPFNDNFRRRFQIMTVYMRNMGM